MAFRADEVHISSNSWGPTDDGKTMAPIGPLTKAALRDGAEKVKKYRLGFYSNLSVIQIFS